MPIDLARDSEGVFTLEESERQKRLPSKENLPTDREFDEMPLHEFLKWEASLSDWGTR